MEQIRDVIRLGHIAIGFLGLAAFWVPIVTKKGARLHITTGKVFAFAVYFVASSAVLNSALLMILAIQAGRGPSTQPGSFGFLVFLSYLGIIVFASGRHGVRVIQTKKNHAELATPTHRALAVSQITGSLVIIAYALVFWSDASIVFLALSPIGVLSGITMWRFMTRPPEFNMSWWYEHMGAMLGAGIGFHTAFAVFGASRLFNYTLTGPLAFLPWVLPAAIGTPAIRIWTRRYMLKFKDLPPKIKGTKSEEALLRG